MTQAVQGLLYTYNKALKHNDTHRPIAELRGCLEGRLTHVLQELFSIIAKFCNQSSIGYYGLFKAMLMERAYKS